MNVHARNEDHERLICPVTKQPLRPVTLAEAESLGNGHLFARPDAINARGGTSKPAGLTETVLLRDDLGCAYPVVDGIAILLAPEMLHFSEFKTDFEITDPKYAEAYEEMDFYNDAATSAAEKLKHGGANSILPTELAATDAEKRSFPFPWHRWIDTVHDSASLWDAYSHLGDLKGKCVVQLGGSGTHAIKFALAGAEEIWLITPILGEAEIARGLADSAGVGDRFRCVVAVAEELPLETGYADAVFAAGCVHHMQTGLAFPEAARILRDGGKFAAAEPWQAPLYSIGTRILGKREDAYCKPLTAERIATLSIAFPKNRTIQHGTLSRYPLLALNKFGINVGKSIPWYLGKADDAICSIIPGMRSMGSSIAILGTK